MSLFSKVAKFASSPQGRAALDKAKAAANDPKNRAKIDGLVDKVKAKGGQGPATPWSSNPSSTPSATPPADRASGGATPPATPPAVTPPATQATPPAESGGTSPA